MVLGVVSSLRRMVAVTLRASLLFLRLIRATLFIRAADFIRIASVGVAGRGRGSPVSHVVQTSAILLVGLLLGNGLFLPLTHALGSDRRGAVVRTLDSGIRTRARRGRAIFRSTWRGALRMVRSVARSPRVLRVSRLGRWHPIVVWSNLASGTAGWSERSGSVRGRIGSVGTI